jgi:DNA-binding transcriptional LysR family regulator
MTLEQLRVFVAVAERQHVTRAAEALNLAQSAASAAIAALEAQYGTKLFDRVGRGIALTEAGRVFLGEARAVLARAEAAELALAELGGLARGTLRVHASQTIASYWLPRRLADFRGAHPAIEIRLGIGNTAQVAAAVHAGVAELGFVEGAVDDAALATAEVARDRMVLVVGAGHAWAARDAVRPDELTTAQWVLREPGSGTRSEFEAALAGFGVSPAALAVALELPSNEAVRAAVEAGLGATVISASVAAPGLEAGLLHLLALPLPERSFQLLHHRERSLSRAAQAFAALTRSRAPARARG